MIKGEMKRTIIVEIISFLFVFLFVYAAVVKLVDYDAFVTQIGSSPILPGNLRFFLAFFIPVLELVAAFLYFFPPLRKQALWLSAGLMAAFTGYVFAILELAPHVPCSCGGVLESLGWTEHLVFNIFFLVLALGGIIIYVEEETHFQKQANA